MRERARCDHRRKQRRQRAARQLASPGAHGVEMGARARRDLGCDFAERGRAFPGEDRALGIEAAGREHVGGKIKAARASVKRHGAQKARERIGGAERAAHFLGASAAHPKNFEREQDERRPGRLGIGFERAEAGRRLRPKIRLARVDEPVEMGPGEAAGANRRRQGLDHLVPAHRPALVDRGNAVAPPLQAHLAEHRLAHHFAGARDLGVEGIERQQRVARLGGREQRGQEPVAVARPHEPHERRAVTLRRHEIAGNSPYGYDNAVDPGHYMGKRAT